MTDASFKAEHHRRVAGWLTSLRARAGIAEPTPPVVVTRLPVHVEPREALDALHQLAMREAAYTIIEGFGRSRWFPLPRWMFAERWPDDVARFTAAVYMNGFPELREGRRLRPFQR